jgi:hypothetical protein
VVEVQRVDLLQLDEVLDVDRARCLGVERPNSCGSITT